MEASSLGTEDGNDWTTLLCQSRHVPMKSKKTALIECAGDIAVVYLAMLRDFVKQDLLTQYVSPQSLSVYVKVELF